MLKCEIAWAGTVVMLLRAGYAAAQPAGPLPELPSSSPDPSQPGGPAQPSGPLPPEQAAPPRYAPSPEPPPPPPPVIYVQPQMPPHAPKFSLWVGGRLGLLGFGGNFYTNELGNGETTGNFVRNGVALEVDAGARLGKRYLPYLFLEHGFMGAGHRFEGTDATASSDLAGIGFRYVAGDVDSAGFLTDLSIGIRTITITSGGSTYKMQALEIFRLGLGAEIRLSTLFTISPLATLSGGVMSDTDGQVNFGAAGSHDGITHPTFQNGRAIDTVQTPQGFTSAQRGYIAVGIGCGAHFDLFGK